MQELAGQTQTLIPTDPTKITASSSPKLARIHLFAQSFAAQGLLAAIALLMLATYYVFYPGDPNASLQKSIMLFGGLVVATLVAVFGALFLLSFYQVARYQKPKSATIAILKQCWRTISEPRRAAMGIPFLAIFLILIHAFVQIKNGIPQIAPYVWDETLHDFDVWLHFGKAPWEWLHPFFSQSPYLVFILNLNYNFWFVSMWMVVVPFAFSISNTVVRTRFFLTFFLVWAIGGGVLATGFSSVGPAFYAKLGLTPDPYAGLMTYLEQANQVVPVWAFELQNTMWNAYKNGGINVGISAMPSMHNATALLFVIGAWHLSKKMAIPLAIHCFLIYIGSIYLAWHYAIDAYLGWLITIVAWLVSGPVARWWHNLTFVQNFDAQLAALVKSTNAD